VYVYLNGMEVKTSISRETVPLILILIAGGSTACTVYLNGMEVKGSPFSRKTVPLILILTAAEAPRVRVPERYGGEGIPLLS
jgi:hypothetical protein